jgi:hypothetical protein
LSPFSTSFDQVFIGLGAPAVDVERVDWPVSFQRGDGKDPTLAEFL